MTARERILALRLLEKQEQHSEYLKRVGIRINMIKKDPQKMEEKNV